MRRELEHGPTAILRDVLRGVDIEWAVRVHRHNYGANVGLEERRREGCVGEGGIREGGVCKGGRGV